MLTCPRCNRSYPDAVVTCSVDGADLRRGLDATTRTVDHAPWASRSVALDLPEGMMIGEYRIEKKLGEGGFGTVYRAVHPVIRKGVAIKVLNPRLASSRDVVSRFVAEARAVNQIRHRNIVDIFSFGVLEDGRHYFVMDLLEGMTLRDYLRKNGRMDVREAIAVLRPLARALDAAHSAGVAHRDLKPDNVFLVLEPDGHVFPKLIDFGLAKLIDRDENDGDHRTRSGAPIGTPKYMSPEQCRGEAVDHRTDLYSLGVVVHELLTGTRPFEAGGMLEMFVQHTTAAPPPMSTVCSDLPPLLDGPVLHMLAKRPEDRPASVSLAIDALARAVDAAMPSSAELLAGSDPALGKRLRASMEAERLGLVAGDSAIGGAEIQVRASPAKRTMLFFGAIAGLAAFAAIWASVRRAATFAPSDQAVAAGGPSLVTQQAPPRSTGEVPLHPNEVTIEIRSTPALVDVFLGDEKIGTSAAPLHLARGDGRIKLTAKAAGYNVADIEVTPNENGFISVTLSKPAPTPSKKTAKPIPSELESPFNGR